MCFHYFSVSQVLAVFISQCLGKMFHFNGYLWIDGMIILEWIMDSVLGYDGVNSGGLELL
jgi:hypothetical protein